jgi:uncharacterized Zn finger protein (UPF0148 family)
MKCCDQEVTTPFCPHCGKPASAVESLYRHVASTAKTQRSIFESVKKDHPQWPTAKREEKIQKWELWRDSLRELIDKH